MKNKQSTNARLLALEDIAREFLERLAALEEEAYGQADKRHNKQLGRLSKFPFEQTEFLQDILDKNEKEATEDLQPS